MDQESELVGKANESELVGKANDKPLSVLKGGKKEPAAGATGSAKPKRAENAAAPQSTEGQAKVSSLIHGLALHMFQKTPDLPPFPHKLHVLRDEEGEAFILEEGLDGEVRRVPTNHVRQYILKYIADTGFALGMAKLTWAHTDLIVQEFMARIPRLIKDPAMVLTKSELGLTYRKLPFDFKSDPGLDCSPTFLEMMARTTNARALMAWIGSLFDPEADMQQYVWLHGGGQNGKSSLGRFLSAVLGNGARSVQPPGLNDRFWTINLIGKRLVIYGDCNNARFVTSGLFKSMTGGDAVMAEIKMGATLQVVLKAKHLFFSNKKPGIDAGEADQRRIILCEMMPIEGTPDPQYEQRLWNEASTFLGQCWTLYLEDAGSRRRIPCDQAAAKDLALENDEFYDSVFNQYFFHRPGINMPASEFIERLKNAGIKAGPDIAKFREYIEKQFGIKRERQPGHGFYYKDLCKKLPTDL